MKDFLLKNILPSKKKIFDYEWMIKNTSQTEWIEKQGVYLWLAFFFSEIGAGLYFIAMLLNNRPCMVIGWLITLCVGGGVHMAYLGNPKRAWRILMKPKTSELSRGVWIIVIFAVFGFFQMAVGGGIFMKVIMGIISILLIMHGFATMNVMKSIPSWSSTMIIPLSIISGIWVGSQIFQLLLGISGGNIAQMEVWSIVFLLVYIASFILYLWSTAHSSEIAKLSIIELIAGDFSRIFIIGVIVIGMVVPILITIIQAGSSVAGGWIFIRLLFVLVGDLVMRYSLMKIGFYRPLI